jgi:antitoxin component HigA of HigAB toxin-antitoxin module
MPAITYEQLLAEMLPARIDTEVQYDQFGARLGDLIGSRSRTPDETKLMHLLCLLIEDYDRRNAMPREKSTPAEMPQFLVEHSGKSAAELLQPVFGQRSHVYEALNGTRPISAEQARKLGKLFSVQPGLFI